MSVDYEQLKAFVKEAMFTGGGINEPSNPVGVPIRTPSADTRDKEQDMGDPAANKMYDIALAAREATENLVEALDDPFYDNAYEQAFKASACLRRVLNSLEESGAHPMPDQRVVAPPQRLQRYGSFASQQGSATYGASPMRRDGGVMDLEESNGGAQEEEGKEDAATSIGAGAGLTKGAHARGEKERSVELASGETLGDITNKERAILVDIEKLLTRVAEKTDLVKYRPMLQAFLKKVLQDSSKEGT